MNIEISYILYGIVVLAFVLFSLYVNLSIRRLVENRIEGKKALYMKQALPTWDAYFRGEENFHEVMIPKNRAEIEAVEMILITYVKNVSDENVRGKISTFANEHLQAYYKKMLHSPKWSKRMNGLYRTIDLHLDSLLPELKKLEQLKLSDEEYFLVLLAYATIEPEYAFEKMMSLEEALSINQYKRLLLELDDDCLPKLVQQFANLSSDFQYTLITVLGIKRNPTYLSFLEKNITHKDPEIRIRTLKAINDIGLVSNLDMFVPFVTSPIWEERLMIAKLLRNVPVRQAYPYLKQLIEDSSWWVRSEAAATMNFTSEGKQLLVAITKASDDRFAVDMATEYMKRSS